MALSIRAVALSVRRLPSIGRAQAFLSRIGQALSVYSDLYDYLFDQPRTSADAKARAGIEYHLTQMRNEILAAFRSQQKYVSITLVEELLFQATKDGRADIVGHVTHQLGEFGLTRNAAVIVPIYAFGVTSGTGLGGLKLIQQDVSFGKGKFVLTPQTNNLAHTASKINDVLKDLGVRFKNGATIDRLEHYIRSRGATWLIRNPLLMGVLNMSAVAKFENVSFVRRLVDKSASTMTCYSALADWKDGLDVSNNHSIWSTRRINNQETLDLNHYIVAQAVGKPASLELDITPMGGLYRDFNDVLGFNIEIRWASRSTWHKRMFDEVQETINHLHDEYAAIRWGRPLTAREKVVTKVIGSLAFFRKSFRSTNEEDLIVNLATAFESLVLDGYGNYSGNLKNALQVRTGFCLGAKAGSKISNAVGELYERRCEIVHAGKNISRGKEFIPAQAGYYYALRFIVRRLAHVQSGETQPIREMFKKAGLAN